MEKLSSLFSSPVFLGFDHFERLIDSMSKAQDNYPPYDIEQIDQYGFRITLAIAGFKRENVSIFLEDNQLTIRGQQDQDPDSVYIYKGIAARRFVKTFVLADGIEVKNAEYIDGLLHINIFRLHGEKEVRKIEIDDSVIITKHSQPKQIDTIR